MTVTGTLRISILYSSSLYTNSTIGSNNDRVFSESRVIGVYSSSSSGKHMGLAVSAMISCWMSVAVTLPQDCLAVHTLRDRKLKAGTLIAL